MLGTGASTDFPLLKTKLYIPPVRSGFVSRASLLQRLQQGVQGTLTLISAPAGFGKTTLLADWAGQSERPVAWISLDEGDNDFPRFLRYLIAAVEEAWRMESGRGFPETLGLLQASQPASPDLLLTTWINELLALPDHLVVVLDDYQFIHSRPVHENLAKLLDQRPPRLHLVIATRIDPPFPLGRLRSLGQLTEIRTADLQFSQDEIILFLNQVTDLPFSTDQVTLLEKRTEGWIAGLQLAALSLQHYRDPSEFLRQFGGSHKFILEYLIEEVLSHQPDSVRHFLLHTAPLGRLHQALCDFVLDDWLDDPGEITEVIPEKRYAGAGMLQRLEKENLFVIPLDQTGTWYRYHHLFADLLTMRLQQAHPERLPILHSRASRWYEDQGLIEEAVQHALAASDPARLADLIERYTLEFISRGEMTILFGWLEGIPETLYRERPELCIQNAWALTFTGQLEAAETRLETVAEEVEGDSSPQGRARQGEVLLMRALIQELRGEMESAVELAQQADLLLPPERLTIRSLIPFIVGDGYFLLGDLARAEQAFLEIETIGQKTGNLWTTSVALSKLAQLKKVQGRLREARQIYRRILDRADERGWSEVGTLAALSVGLSDLLREWNRLEEAREMAAGAVERMEHWLSPTDRVNGWVVLSRIYRAQGETAAEIEALERAGQAARRGKIFPITQAQLDACQVRMAVSQKDQAFLQQNAQDPPAASGKQPEDLQLDLVSEIRWTAQVRVWMALEEWGRAAESLDLLILSAKTGGRSGWLIELLTLQAQVLHAQNHREDALSSLKQALDLAQPEGYRRVFLDEDARLFYLLQRIVLERTDWFAGQEAPLLDYAQELLGTWQEQSEVPGLSPSEQPLVEPLSKRELEVLALVCQGLTNQEIAERLFITQNTVKKHTYNIYGKLQVSNRTQAVIRADELGLFPLS